jgi:hypothetical protein
MFITEQNGNKIDTINNNPRRIECLCLILNSTRIKLIPTTPGSSKEGGLSGALSRSQQKRLPLFSTN